MEKNYDFSGWATKNDLLCADGRVIRKDAFAHQDGTKVPLVWNHNWTNPENVLGHAFLYNHPEGVRAEGYFNDTPLAQKAKIAVVHGDITGLSIWANQLDERSKNVMHGRIRELSLVMVGANPGAFIDEVIAHGDNEDGGAIIYTGEELEPNLAHADSEKSPAENETKNSDTSDKTVGEVYATFTDKQKQALSAMVAIALMGDDAPKPESIPNSEKGDSSETLEDVFNTFNKAQKDVAYVIIGKALEESKDAPADKNQNEETNSKEETVMHSNAFDAGTMTDTTEGILTHADQEAILNLAKRQTGSLRSAIEAYCGGEGADHLAHGIDEIETLFPEYKNVGAAAPEMILADQGWISTVMNGVSKSPFSRIRTRQMDVKSAALRALGYKKGNLKKEMGDVRLLKRTTDPQTVYVKDSLNHDDIVDITDFDVVDYEWKLMRLTLNEELATAFMIGDRRDDADEDKIHEDHIRPIYTDDELYTIHKTIDTAAMATSLQGTDTSKHFGEEYIYAEAFIKTMLDAMIDYRGSGNTVMFCTPQHLNKMLLARDMNGRRIYNTVAELASALNVSKIETVEQFAGVTREVNSTTKKLLAIVVNMKDYQVGATKGGEITNYNQFDIDFNKEKFLIETRVSGALVKIKSAIVLEEDAA